MPKLQADFSKISSSFESLPAGSYRARIDDITEGETKENKIPQITFKLVVTEGDMENRVITDFVTLKTKEGKRNDIGYGRVKAYAEAIMGEEYANSGELDTDDLKGGTVEIVVAERTYEAKDGSGQKTSSDIKKVLPVG